MLSSEFIAFVESKENAIHEGEIDISKKVSHEWMVVRGYAEPEPKTPEEAAAREAKRAEEKAASKAKAKADKKARLQREAADLQAAAEEAAAKAARLVAEAEADSDEDPEVAG